MNKFITSTTISISYEGSQPRYTPEAPIDVPRLDTNHGTPVPLETATYVSDLVASNPAASDPLAGADDHLRLIKATTKATLAHTGPLTNTDNQLIPAAGTSTKPAYAFAAEPSLGFFRPSAGVITLAGGQLRNGAPLGSVHMFLVDSWNIGNSAKGTLYQPYEFLELDGATWPNSVYPALAALLAQGGSTFTLPDMRATGRFPRSRTASLAAGIAQANTVGPHTHPDVTTTTAAENATHTHAFSGTTGNDSPDHTHAGALNQAAAYNSPGGSTVVAGNSTTSTGGASTRHQHSFSGTTGIESAVHAHSVTVSTPANTGTTETRPEALTFIFAVKT